MLQTLLADRFKLKTHREMRELSAYALAVGKNGHKLRASKESVPWTLSRAGGIEPRSGRIIFKDEPMPDFASALTKLVVIGRVVVDQTGLKGNYDFELTFAPPERLGEPTSEAPSIFTAIQEQLGLKLEPHRAPGRFSHHRQGRETLGKLAEHRPFCLTNWDTLAHLFPAPIRLIRLTFGIKLALT